MTKLRTSLKNKIHNILNANGIVSQPEMFSSEKVTQLNLDACYRFEVSLLVDEIRHLNESIEKISDEIKSRGEKLTGHKNLISIKGISDTGTTIFLNTIGNVNDFKDEKLLASYFGIVPRVYNSNETIRHGRITKMGNKIARTMPRAINPGSEVPARPLSRHLANCLGLFTTPLKTIGCLKISQSLSWRLRVLLKKSE